MTGKQYFHHNTHTNVSAIIRYTSKYLSCPKLVDKVGGSCFGTCRRARPESLLLIQTLLIILSRADSCLLVSMDKRSHILINGWLVSPLCYRWLCTFLHWLLYFTHNVFVLINKTRFFFISYPITIKASTEMRSWSRLRLRTTVDGNISVANTAFKCRNFD